MHRKRPERTNIDDADDCDRPIPDRCRHRLRTTIAGAALLVCGLGTAPGAQAQHLRHQSLGVVDFPVSCSAQAREGFETAAALLHHMTYPRARSAFAEVAQADPDCAMAHWGIAMTLFQPLWPTRPGPEELELGWREAGKAAALQPPTRRERLFVATAVAFFLEPQSTDYWLRIRRWAEATARLHEAFPDDPEVATFYALSLLATAPADRVVRDNADQAAAILLAVLQQNPEHPGAMHYLVHANDTPGRERESLEVTRRYEAAAPRNPHALHMPTHIYTRLGDWAGVVRGNLQAAEAALEHPAGDNGELVWDEFPHAIEYLVYAYLQQGDDEQAAAQLRRLQATEHLQISFKTAFHLASTASRYALERRDWAEAAALAPPVVHGLDWDRFAWPHAILIFARGLGAARLGDADSAKAAVDRLGGLESATRAGGEELFGRNIQVLRLELQAWIAELEGRHAAAVSHLREAAELETSTPKHAVTPGPTLPAYELLGDLLWAQKEPAAALAAYERSLESYPRRFNSLLGAARAAVATSDSTRARSRYQQLLEITAQSSRPGLTEAKRYLGSG